MSNNRRSQARNGVQGKVEPRLRQGKYGGGRAFWRSAAAIAPGKEDQRLRGASRPLSSSASTASIRAASSASLHSSAWAGWWKRLVASKIARAEALRSAT